jgi:hypothetical protein
MNIPDIVMKTRKKLATDLRKLTDILYKYFPTAEITSIEQAITFLRNPDYIPQVPDEDSNPNYWGYALNSIIFKFDSIPRHTTPSNCKDLKIIIDLKAIGINSSFAKNDDPLRILEFNIVIEATKFNANDNKQVSTSYHLDRQIFNKEDNDSEYPHPIYHFQFGGRKLTKGKEIETGDLLILDSPRIGHYPMEGILGIDFVISNFFPTVWKKMRNECAEYTNLISEYQDLFVKPYIQMHSIHWKTALPIESSPIWNPTLICPQLT